MIWGLGNLGINIIMASLEEKVKTVVGGQSQSQTQTQTQSIVAEMKLLKEMHQHSGVRKTLNLELWHACAGPLVSLPQLGGLVYYFPQGRSEQVAASTRRTATSQIPNYPNLPSQLLCQVQNVTLHADKETDEIYAQMTLQPLNSHTWWLLCSKKSSRKAQKDLELVILLFLSVEFVKMFRHKTGYQIVEPAHMELAEPSIGDAFQSCVQQGAQRVIISPFFLSPGRHWSQDIPSLSAEAAKQHPGVSYIVTAPLGLHELLVEGNGEDAMGNEAELVKSLNKQRQRAITSAHRGRKPHA